MPSLGVYYCQQLTLVCCLDVLLSGCLSVCHKLQIASFLFLDGIEPFFGRQFSMTPSTKLFSSIFDLGPLMPKICTKSPISRLVWQIDRICLGLPGGFQGWSIQWNHAKCCGRPLLPWQRNLGSRLPAC